MKKKINLSIVCATHNRPVKLSKMVESFNNGKILPKELIICGTAYKDFNYVKGKKIDFDLKFLISKKKNQIIQRRKAIQFARNDFILQIDDDVIVEKNFVFNLEKYTRSKKKNNHKCINTYKSRFSASFILEYNLSKVFYIQNYN